MPVAHTAASGEASTGPLPLASLMCHLRPSAADQIQAHFGCLVPRCCQQAADCAGGTTASATSLQTNHGHCSMRLAPLAPPPCAARWPTVPGLKAWQGLLRKAPNTSPCSNKQHWTSYLQPPACWCPGGPRQDHFFPAYNQSKHLYSACQQTQCPQTRNHLELASLTQ